VKCALLFGGALFVVAAAAFRVSRYAAGFWGIDDAGITYGAAFQFADQGSLGANVEGTPVESYSNPLVFFVVALLRVIGLFDPVTTHVRIEMLLFGGMVTLVWALLRKITGDIAAVIAAGAYAALELLTPATWLWYGSGLENVWVSAGLVALVWICARTLRGVPLAPGWGALACAVALTRPEAPVYVAGFYVALAGLARPAELPWRTHLVRVALALGVTTALFVGFLAWRRIGYGDWLPNTYYAKATATPPLLHNLRYSVIHNILPYARAGLLACSVLVVVAMRTYRRLALVLMVMLVASLALPLTAGEDYAMGEHRFATPFLAMCHASFAVLVAVSIGFARSARPYAIGIAAVVATMVLPVVVTIDRWRAPTPYLDVVSIGRVAEEEGALRWEHQMRIGVPYAVVIMPDAGGSTLVGGMQMVDDALLADYDFAHIGPYYGDPAILRQLNQYSHEERRADLASDSTAIGAFDLKYVGTRYLKGPGSLLPRVDLVEAAEIDPRAQLLYGDDHLRVYLSPATVAIAAPGALVRCELIVAWFDQTPDDVAIRGALDADRDEIQLQPYRPGARGIERRALLLGAPAREGAAPITLEISRGEQRLFAGKALDVNVTKDETAIARAAEQILAEPSTLSAMRRLAWFREQRIPRFTMTRFCMTVRALHREDVERDPRAGKRVLSLRWNARLATFEELPRSIRTAELTAIRRLVSQCTQRTDDASRPQRVACLGRAIDELRRMGYLGVLDRVPELAAELTRARSQLAGLAPAQRYLLLVGLTFAFPSDMPLRRALIGQRRALEIYPELPAF